MKLNLESKKRIVIKIGSSLLVAGGKLRKKWLKNFVRNLADLSKEGFEIIIVSSGSVALGKGILEVKDKDNISLEEKQAAAAIGQIQLMSSYRDLFREFDVNVAQILMTAADCNSRTRYLNSTNTVETLIENKIIPIINENDSMAVDEIKIGDNDRLAARVAQVVSADILVLFSDIDGLYNENPKTNKKAKLIPEVRSITKSIEAMAGGAGSSVGTGGMTTKIMAAKMLINSGCDTVITNGYPENALNKIMDGSQNFTIFYSKKKSIKSRKNWIAGILNVKGSVVIDALAKTALLTKENSLLPVGVLSVSGEFKKGAVILIKDETNHQIASGISNYSSANLKKILLKKTSEVKKILGKSAERELVHIDNLVVV